jgi:hypothetical protein
MSRRNFPLLLDYIYIEWLNTSTPNPTQNYVLFTIIGNNNTSGDNVAVVSFLANTHVFLIYVFALVFNQYADILDV